MHNISSLRGLLLCLQLILSFAIVENAFAVNGVPKSAQKAIIQNQFKEESFSEITSAPLIAANEKDKSQPKTPIKEKIQNTFRPLIEKITNSINKNKKQPYKDIEEGLTYYEQTNSHPEKLPYINSIKVQKYQAPKEEMLIDEYNTENSKPEPNAKEKLEKYLSESNNSTNTESDDYIEYKVSTGENIISIAKKFKSPVKNFIEAIFGNKDIDVVEGDTLYIPITSVQSEGTSIAEVAIAFKVDQQYTAIINKIDPSKATEQSAATTLLPIFDATRKIVITRRTVIPIVSTPVAIYTPPATTTNLSNQNTSPEEKQNNSNENKIEQSIIPQKKPENLNTNSQTILVSTTAKPSESTDDAIKNNPAPTSETTVPQPKPSNLKTITAPTKIEAVQSSPSTKTEQIKDSKMQSSEKQPTKTSPSDTPDWSGVFSWPLRGKLLKAFIKEGEGKNEGINIAANVETPVKAAAPGVVFYAGGDVENYGNLIILKHGNGYLTIYGNNSQILVKKGDQIKSGDIIAKSGKTGNVKVPQLFFAIRKDKQAVDPLAMLK